MGQINVLFFCSVPLYIHAFQSLFSRDKRISFTAIKCRRLDDIKYALNKGRNIVIIEDSIIKTHELSKTAEILAGCCGGVRFIIFTSRLDKKYLNSLSRRGIKYIISKNEEPKKIKKAVLLAAKGVKYIDYSKRKSLNFKKIHCEGLPDLNRQESAIFHLIAMGYGNKDIADTLFLSVKTIESYKVKIISKFHLKNSRELLRFSIRTMYKFIVLINIFLYYFFDMDLNIF